MADFTFTLDWRVRTRKHETLMRAKLDTLDAKLSLRKRVRGPVRIDAANLFPAPPEEWDNFVEREAPMPVAAPVSRGEIPGELDEEIIDLPILRRAIG